MKAMLVAYSCAAFLIFGSIGCASEGLRPVRTVSTRSVSSVVDRVFNEYAEPGALIVAAVAANDQSEEDPFFRIQLGMVEAAIAAGPIVIAIPDGRTRNSITESCVEHPRTCQGVRDGRIRLLDIPHDGPWVRDYGPQVAVHENSYVVLDADYSDVRQQKSLLRKRIETDRERLTLIKMRESVDDDSDDRDLLMSFSSASSFKQRIDDRLSVLAQLKDVYSNDSMLARDEDDAAPFYLAQATFREPHFRMLSTGLSLDGGNLMRLGDGACATTTDLVAANKANTDVDRILRSIYACSRVVYLAPLPGPVIKHVDMFLLPIDDSTVLLASYDPERDVIRRHWEESDDRIRSLTMEAAAAMDVNAKLLSALGFKVVRVPAPLPRRDAQFDVYYPTNLNALVRVAADGRRHVIVPTYDGYQDDLQAAGLAVIKTVFSAGPVTTIEATEAARRQGAVHCLSLQVPLAATAFADRSADDKWRSMATNLTQIAEAERRASARILGRWRTGESSLYSFGEDGSVVIVDADGIHVAKYSLRNGGRLLEVTGQESEHVISYRVEWKESGSLVLIQTSHGGEKRSELKKLHSK